MKVLDKVKKLICNVLIIDEWIKNGEFGKAETVMVVGTKTQAVIVRLLFIGKAQKISYCTVLHGEYRHNVVKKWIIFDNRYRETLPRNDSGILWMPDT